MFQRISIVITLILIAVLFIPAHFPSTLGKPGKDEAIIHFQECGCPCPDALVKEEHFSIPDSLAEKLKQNEFLEIYLENDSDIDYESSQFDIKIKGKIIGANPDFCDGNDCYYTPIVRIDSWEIADYVSWFWNWDRNFAMSYLLVTLMSSIVTLVLSIIKIVEKFDNRNSKRKA